MRSVTFAIARDVVLESVQWNLAGFSLFSEFGMRKS